MDVSFIRCKKDKVVSSIVLNMKRFSKYKPVISIRDEFDASLPAQMFVFIFSSEFLCSRILESVYELKCPVLALYVDVRPSKVWEAIGEKGINFSDKIIKTLQSICHDELVCDTMRNEKIEDVAKRFWERLVGCVEEQNNLAMMRGLLSRSGATLFGQPAKKQLLSLDYSETEYGSLEHNSWKHLPWHQLSKIYREESLPSCYLNVMVQPYARVNEFNLFLKLHLANLLVCVPDEEFRDTEDHLGPYPSDISFHFEPQWNDCDKAVPVVDLKSTSEHGNRVKLQQKGNMIGFRYELESNGDGKPDLPFNGLHHPNLNHILAVEWALTQCMIPENKRVSIKLIVEYSLKIWNSVLKQSFLIAPPKKLLFLLNTDLQTAFPSIVLKSQGFTHHIMPSSAQRSPSTPRKSPRAIWPLRLKKLNLPKKAYRYVKNRLGSFRSMPLWVAHCKQH